jgi:hypothetical protein
MKKDNYPPERLLTETEVENLYGIKRKTLQHDRARGQGLPFIKLGSGKKGRVRYPKYLSDEYIRKSAKGGPGTADINTERNDDQGS